MRALPLALSLLVTFTVLVHPAPVQGAKSVLKVASLLPANLTETLVSGFEKVYNVSVSVSYPGQPDALNHSGFDVVLAGPTEPSGNLTSYLARPNLSGYAETFPNGVGGECTVCLGGRAFAFAQTELGIMVNNAYLAEYGLPVPSTYFDLGKEAYEGHLILANPETSATTLQFVTALVGQLGWRAGWEVIKNMTANSGILATTSSDAADYVAEGKYGATVTTADRAVPYIEAGLPVEFVYPRNQTFASLAYVGVADAALNNPTALEFLNYTLSYGGQSLVALGNTGYAPLSLTAYLNISVSEALAAEGVVPALTDSSLSHYNQSLERFDPLILALFDSVVYFNMGPLERAWNQIAQAEELYRLSTQVFGRSDFTAANLAILNSSLRDFYYLPPAADTPNWTTLSLVQGPRSQEIEISWQRAALTMYQDSYSNATHVQSPLNQLILNNELDLRTIELEIAGLSLVFSLVMILLYHAFYVVPKVKRAN